MQVNLPFPDCNIKFELVDAQPEECNKVTKRIQKLGDLAIYDQSGRFGRFFELALKWQTRDTTAVVDSLIQRQKENTWSAIFCLAYSVWNASHIVIDYSEMTNSRFVLQLIQTIFFFRLALTQASDYNYNKTRHKEIVEEAVDFQNENNHFNSLVNNYVEAFVECEQASIESEDFSVKAFRDITRSVSIDLLTFAPNIFKYLFTNEEKENDLITNTHLKLVNLLTRNPEIGVRSNHYKQLRAELTSESEVDLTTLARDICILITDKIPDKITKHIQNIISKQP